MKIYTQADFDALIRDADGYMHLPSGDWRAVEFGGAGKLVFDKFCVLGNDQKLGKLCVFRDGCALGKRCIVGRCCRFGENCTLGELCMVGKHCRFEAKCNLGKMCMLGYNCALGPYCKLGSGCFLGDFCRLGEHCEFDKDCKLGRKCELENGAIENAVFFKVSNIGSRNDDAYAFCNIETGKIFVRAGCWFGNINDFEVRVHEVHAGTKHEQDYKDFCGFARARFRKYNQGGKN